MRVVGAGMQKGGGRGDANRVSHFFRPVGSGEINNIVLRCLRVCVVERKSVCVCACVSAHYRMSNMLT